jgi:putative transposase
MDTTRFQDDIYIYAVTYTIKDWIPIFIDPEPIRIIIDGLNAFIEQEFLRINAYIVMPHHLHMMVFDAEYNNNRMEQTLINFRKDTGHKLAEYIDAHQPTALAAAIYDRGTRDRVRQVWQPNWQVEGIPGKEAWQARLNELQMNPVRKGFVYNPEHWRYSSARYWLLGEKGDVPISNFQWEDQ